MILISRVTISCSAPSLGPFVSSVQPSELTLSLFPRTTLKIQRPLEGEVRRLYPNAPIFTNSTPGYETGARSLTGDLRRLLITRVGIRKIMGSPLQTPYSAMSGSTCLNDDIVWVKARANVVAAEAILFFAHLGLEGVDAAASGYVGPDKYYSYKRAAATLPEDESQIKFFLARYNFMPRLQCVARSRRTGKTERSLFQN